MLNKNTTLDRNQIEQHLAALGFKHGDAVYLRSIGPRKLLGMSVHIPQSCLANWSDWVRAQSFDLAGRLSLSPRSHLMTAHHQHQGERRRKILYKSFPIPLHLPQLTSVTVTE